MAIATISPFDALARVTFAPDCKSARLNRYGIGFGQRGYAGNVHYATLAEAEAAFEERLADLRKVYGTPARNWTGRYLEEALPIAPGVRLFRRVRFIPLRKNGKHGAAIHMVYLYPIDEKPGEIDAIEVALKIPVS
jgi:hypothetical protein